MVRNLSEGPVFLLCGDNSIIASDEDLPETLLGHVCVCDLLETLFEVCVCVCGQRSLFNMIIKLIQDLPVVI